MENQTTSQLNLQYSLENTPWYFGAYLNMARHNLFLIVNHLTEKFLYLKFERLRKDEELNKKSHILSEIFDTKKEKYSEERFKVYKYLVKKHYLPFIQIFHENKGHKLDSNPIVYYDELHNCLQSIFEIITSFRNSYTHYLAIDDNKIKVENRKKEVPENIKNLLVELFKHAPEFSLQRFEVTQNKEHFNHLKLYRLFEDNSQNLSEHGFYFFINLFLERSYAYKFLKRLKGFKNETLPTFRATLQTFTAYSLRLPDERLDSEDTRYELLMDMLNELQRCPKELFNHLSEEDKSKFKPLLDEEKRNNILNNTNYESISDEAIDELLAETTSLRRVQNRFPYFALRFIDEFELLPNIRFQINVGKLHLKQYEKRIIGVATDRRILKSIKRFGKLSDFENKEESILTQIKREYGEGVYFEQYSPHYNLETNKIPFILLKSDGSEEISPTKTPIGFISVNDLPKILALIYFDAISGQKQNTVEKRIEEFLKINNEFIFNQGELDKIKEQLELNPETFTRRIEKLNNLKQKGKIAYLNSDEESKLLKNWHITKSELLRLDQTEMGKKAGKNKKNLEYARQIRYREFLLQRRSELQKHLPKDLLSDQLPTKVYDYLLEISKALLSKRIHKKIRAIKEDCKIRRKRLKKELEKSKEEQNIKLGEIATFLARDIINMVVSKAVKDKITTPYYSKLQNKFAYFSISKHEIIELCDELKLFDQKEGHVFLQKEDIRQAKGILEFYDRYLERKIMWIEDNLFKKGKDGGYFIPKEIEKQKRLPYSILRLKNDIEDSDFILWLKNKASMPVNVPNSLFDNELTQKLHVELHKKKIQFNHTDKFSVLLAKLLNGDTQPFYNYHRVYKINEKERKIKVQGKDSKTLKERYGKYVSENEKKIRYVQMQDRVIKLMCDRIISEIGNDYKKKIQLSSVEPFSEKSSLNRPFEFSQRIVRKGSKNYFVVIGEDTERQKQEVETFLKLTSEKERNEYRGQKWYAWTIKDFGRFKRLVHDRRIPNLSAYFENNKVSFDFIKYQLDEYDKYREKIFQETFDFEKKISEKFFNDIASIEMMKRKNREDTFFEIQFNVYEKFLRKNRILNDEEITSLTEIRNKFSHSQFPENVFKLNQITQANVEVFDKLKLEKGKVKELNLSICQKIYEKYKTICNKI